MDSRNGNNEFNKFDSAMGDFILNDLESAREILEENGFDPDAESEANLKMLRRLVFLEKAQNNLEKDRGLIEQALVLLKDQINANLSKTSEVLKSILGEKRASFQFRNLDKLEDQDLREILIDVDLVGLIEQLEAED